MNYSERLFDVFMSPLEAAGLARLRARMLGEASGRVLEIGAGTGANLPFYDWSRVRSLTLTDVEPARLLRLRANAACRGRCVVSAADVHRLPFASDCFDTVVVTLVLCSVAVQLVALTELARVLSQSGRLILIEHVRPPGALGVLADRLNPAWYACNGECRINRNTLESVRAAGFAIDSCSSHGRGALVAAIASHARETGQAEL
ncbi:MAG: class I SAM-dependent methyltransferase [Spirochaetota bacterium]